MQEEANRFKALAEPLRLRLAVLLASQGEVCVCHLAQALNEQDFKVSKHLGVMRSAEIVEVRRQGTWMYYRMAPAKTGLDKCLQKCLRLHFADQPTAQMDLKRLEKALEKNKRGQQ